METLKELLIALAEEAKATIEEFPEGVSSYRLEGTVLWEGGRTNQKFIHYSIEENLFSRSSITLNFYVGKKIND